MIAGRKMATRIALHLIVASVVLAFLTPFTGIPSLNYGIWNQSEPPANFLHGCAALGAFGFALLLFGERRVKFSDALTHPLVLIAFALAGWSMIASLFHALPGLTWFGAPETGSGVFRFLELAIFLASGLVVMRFKRARLIVFVTALVVTVIIALATYAFRSGISDALAPYFFTDYLAFNGICLAAMAWAYPYGRKRWLISAIVCVIAIGVLVYSSNRAAIAIALGVTPVFMVVLWALPRIFSKLSVVNVQRLATAGIAASVVVLTALVGILEVLGSATGSSFLAQNLGSRSRLLDIVFRALEDSPSIYSIGNGWGTYSHLLASYLPTEWATLRDDSNTWGNVGVDMAAGSWDSIKRVDFHSHNEFVETLLSVGSVGVLLLIALFALIPLLSRQRLRIAASGFSFALASLAALWFFFPLHIPLIAGAMAGFAKATPARFRLKKGVLLVVTSSIAVLLFATAIYSENFSRSTYYYLPVEPAPSTGAELETCAANFDDFGQGGQHLMYRMRTYAGFIERRIASESPISDEHISYFRGLLCATEKYLDSHDNIHLAIADLNTIADLSVLNIPVQLQPLMAAHQLNWGARLEQVLARIPTRTDLAATYLSRLLATGQDATFNRIAAQLHHSHPSGVVPLWFSGIALLTSEQTKEFGVLRMRKALQLGIERIIPIDPILKQQLGLEPAPAATILPQSTVKLSASGKIFTINVEVANSPKTRTEGLKFRTFLPPRSGMLLLFPSPQEVQIWMEETYIPLDIIYLDEQGYIIEIVQNAEPRKQKPLPAVANIKAVLEVPAGTVTDIGLLIGDRSQSSAFNLSEVD